LRPDLRGEKKKEEKGRKGEREGSGAESKPTFDGRVRHLELLGEKSCHARIREKRKRREGERGRVAAARAELGPRVRGKRSSLPAPRRGRGGKKEKKGRRKRKSTVFPHTAQAHENALLAGVRCRSLDRFPYFVPRRKEEGKEKGRRERDEGKKGDVWGGGGGTSRSELSRYLLRLSNLIISLTYVIEGREEEK